MKTMEIEMLPDVDVVELDNGFRALLVERGPLPVVASVLWYQVGSRDEHTGETGLSHFLEHMMFKGTKEFGKGQIDVQTSKMGGSNNAFTDTDSTAYYFSMAADRWETALEIEASRMRGCLLDPVEFESEKSVVLEELAMGEDEPWRPLYQATESMLYQAHPYHHPIIGYKEELERLKAKADAKRRAKLKHAEAMAAYRREHMDSGPLLLGELFALAEALPAAGGEGADRLGLQL